MTLGAIPPPPPAWASKVSHLYSVSPWGSLTGAPICALEHLQVMKPHFNGVYLILCEHGPLEDRAQSAGIPFRCIPIEFRGLRKAGPWKLLCNLPAVVHSRWTYVREICKLLREKPGILHVHGRAAHLPYALLAGWWARAPVVVTVHEPWNGGAEALTEVWMIRLLADHVVFLSHEMSRQYRPYIKNKFSIVYNHSPMGSVREPLSARDRLVVTMPARMGQRKGYDVFLKVCRLLRDRGGQFVSRMVGGWNSQVEQRQAFDFIREHEMEEVVKDCGIVADMEPIYAETDVVLITSRRDPFPRVVMEAMCHGIPVVATRVDGIPEMVEDGVTGFLVESEDIEGFAGSLERLLKDAALRRRMGAAGWERAKTLFAPEAYAAAMRDIYRSLAVRA